MAKTKFKDSEILQAMEYHVDRESVVFGANGHYGVGAQYNLYENYEKAEETEAAKAYDESIDEELKKAAWMFYV